MFKIDKRLDAYEPISFRLGMIIDITKLYILIPVFNHSVVIWHEQAQTLSVVGYVRI